MRKPRPLHRIKFWWKTLHWDQSHFPGCPVRYGTGIDCFDPDLLCATARRRGTRLSLHRSQHGYGWSVTLYVRDKHRIRWNSRKATTPMLWRFIRGGDEDCNRAITLTLWPLGMLDVWWEPKWRPVGSGPCDACRSEFDLP